MMEIRPFETPDEGAVIALWSACGLTVPNNDPAKDVARKLKVLPELFLVGEVDGDVVGSVMGGYDGHRGWVHYLAVHPEHQRRGYGRQVMTELEGSLISMGCPKLNLQIRDTNAEVAQFYAAIGYTEEPRISFGKRLISDEE